MAVKTDYNLRCHSTGILPGHFCLELPLSCRSSNIRDSHRSYLPGAVFPSRGSHRRWLILSFSQKLSARSYLPGAVYSRGSHRRWLILSFSQKLSARSYLPGAVYSRGFHVSCLILRFNQKICLPGAVFKKDSQKRCLQGATWS